MAKQHQVSPEAKPAGATIYSVAERAGVSIATVSRVLQGVAVVAETTRQKVLRAVDELGYVPLGAARSLAVRHHEAHGLVLPELSGPYYAELLMGFEARAAELAQSVVLVLTNSRTDLAAAVRQLATRVDAIAVFGAAATSHDVLRLLHAKKPVVVIAGEPRDQVEAVTAENLESARELAGHVLDHGRRRALFVGDPDSGPDIRDRYAGFVAAHDDRGLTAAEPVRVALREADGAAFAQELLQGEHEADALMCANDELALSVMTTLQDAGRTVPGDIAVVGWDDVMTSRYVRPGLTTVRQPVHELGALAASRLHDLVSGEPVRTNAQTLPTQLVVRSSCGCP
ncbi:LacI family transcriptional regulator [Lentzea guizhouensis]|uniref:LacI family transcriptional regulator n=1 Tax=Lentzea guizhouensis TaxID=1586287 RepID=A0A1B2HRH6_9PSEU|nr:LacI family DNA-binding transcriptional regulator [Lentzea guizhouensis]ANZ40329.1 LacI family transcriptional regulator [Lentzea guizhouensis]